MFYRQQHAFCPVVIDEHDTFVLQEFDFRRRLPFIVRGDIVG